MKKLTLLSFLLLSLLAGAQTPADRQKAESLLRQMTLDEKIGQMTQVTLGVVSAPTDGVLDPAKLTKAVREYKAGSILDVTGHALTVDQWHKVSTQIQDEARQTRLKIPVISGLDGIHGQTYTL